MEMMGGVWKWWGGCGADGGECGDDGVSVEMMGECGDDGVSMEMMGLSVEMMGAVWR